MTQDEDGAAAGAAEPPGPQERRADADPHHALNNPLGEPDPTEWPDPYERRPDPRYPGERSGPDAPHTPDGAISTSEPHPDQDPQAPVANPPARDRADR